MENTGKKKSTEGFWDNFKQILFAIVLALLIKTSIVEAYKIPSQSMENTLLVGDFLLANKFIYGARVPM
ncbi:MAG: S26 family signal peptidase, partial [Candidatus Zixiibacteriota bacterium]